MIGEVIAEFTGRTTNVRVLPEGIVEFSDSATGKILGVEVTVLDTGIQTPMPSGIYRVEVNGLFSTDDGETVVVKFNGIAWSTGKGLKSSFRGATFWKTDSQKLMHLNKAMGVFEAEQDEEGNWTAKVWEWK